MQPGDASLFACLTVEYAIEGQSPSYESAEAFNKRVRDIAEPRGARYTHDHPDTCMYIARSKNLNVVAYTANLMHDGAKVATGEGCECTLKADDPVHAYFVNLEPSYLEERRRKGIMYDCDDLKIHERMFAYGCNVSPLSSLTQAAAATGNGSPASWLHKLHHGAKEAAAHPSKAEALKWVVDPVKAEAMLKELLAVPEDHADKDSLSTPAAHVIAWWKALKPATCHFVALSTWPGVLLCLPPLAHHAGANKPHSEPAPDAETAHAEKAHAEKADAEKTDTEKAAAEKADASATPAATSRRPAPEDTFVVIVVVIDNQLSILNRVYVKSIEPKWFGQMPSVEYIEAFGTSLATGEATYEKKMNT